MNSANLQLEGLYLAIAAVNEALVDKGLLSRSELETALKRAEQTALGDDRSAENLRSAEREAMAFPARVLRLASEAGSEGEVSTFSDLARRVGRTKPPLNDQM
jgi:hypothetical protein